MDFSSESLVGEVSRVFVNGEGCNEPVGVRGVKRRKGASCPFGAGGKRQLIVDDAKPVDASAESDIRGVR